MPRAGMVEDNEHTQIIAELCRSTKQLRINGRLVKALYKSRLSMRTTDAAVLLERSTDRRGERNAESGGLWFFTFGRNTGWRGHEKRKDGWSAREQDGDGSDRGGFHNPDITIAFAGMSEISDSDSPKEWGAKLNISSEHLPTAVVAAGNRSEI